MKRTVSLCLIMMFSLSASDDSSQEKSKLLYNSVSEICLFWSVGLDLASYERYHHMIQHECDINMCLNNSPHVYNHEKDDTLTCTELLKYIASQCCLTKGNGLSALNCSRTVLNKKSTNNTEKMDELLSTLAKKLQ